MSVILLKCFNAFENPSSTANWNLMYCFVADSSKASLVFADLMGNPFGDPDEYVRQQVRLHFKSDMPKSPEEWLNAVTSRLIFDGLADRSFASFEDAVAEARKLCNEGLEVRAFMKKKRVGVLRDFPFNIDFALRESWKRLSERGSQ